MIGIFSEDPWPSWPQLPPADPGWWDGLLGMLYDCLKCLGVLSLPGLCGHLAYAYWFDKPVGLSLVASAIVSIVVCGGSVYAIETVRLALQEARSTTPVRQPPQ